MGSHITIDTKSIKTFQINSTQFEALKSSVTSPVPNFNMKVFTMSCLVFVVVAIAMIATTTGEITGKCEFFGTNKRVSKKQSSRIDGVLQKHRPSVRMQWILLDNENGIISWATP